MRGGRLRPGASALSATLGELLEASAIGAIVIVNAAIGFVQEHRADRAVMALGGLPFPVLTITVAPESQRSAFCRRASVICFVGLGLSRLVQAGLPR